MTGRHPNAQHPGDRSRLIAPLHGGDFPPNLVAFWPGVIAPADLIRLRLAQAAREAGDVDLYSYGFHRGFAEGAAFVKSRRPVVEELPPHPLWLLAARLLREAARACALYSRAELKRLAQARYLRRRMGR